MLTMLKRIKHRGQFFSFIFIFVIIFILRFWKVPDFFIFTFSEEWQGTLAWELVKDFHIIWIGVSQANIHFYLGPGFIYFNYLLFMLGKGGIEILPYTSAMLGMMTVFCLFYITDKLFSRQVAIFATIFYGCSTLINYYDRRFWNPSFIPIMTPLFVYSLIKSNQNTRWFILTTLLIAASFHFHLLLLLYLLPWWGVGLLCVPKEIYKSDLDSRRHRWFRNCLHDL